MRQPSMVIILLMTSLLELCLGNYTFEVLLENFSNPRHKLADGRCCNLDRYNNCRRAVCKNMFIFCVRPYGYLAKTSLDHQCPDSDQKYLTSLFPRDNIAFKEGQVLNFLTNTTNPLVFHGGVWPGQVQLYTQVYNWNMFGNEFIDDVVQLWSLPVGTGSYSSSQTFRSQGGHVTLTAKARVLCADKYYGHYCSTYCGEKGCGTNDTVLLSPSRNKESDIDSSGSNTTSTLNQSADVNKTEEPLEGLEEREKLTGGAGNSMVENRAGKIVGGVIGGVICLILLSAVAVVCVWCLRRKRAEEQSLAASQDRGYKTIAQSSDHTSHSGSGGTYRRVNNKIYNQISSDDYEGIVNQYGSDTDFTISEAATAPSDQSHGSGAVNNPLYISAPVTSQYSLVRRRDSDVSTSHSEEEPAEGEPKEDERPLQRKPVESQYSVVTRENMEGVEEASDSEVSLDYSDSEPELEHGQDQESDFDPRSNTEHSTIPLYENIPYNYS